VFRSSRSATKALSASEVHAGFLVLCLLGGEREVGDVAGGVLALGDTTRRLGRLHDPVPEVE